MHRVQIEVSDDDRFYGAEYYADGPPSTGALIEARDATVATFEALWPEAEAEHVAVDVGVVAASEMPPADTAPTFKTFGG